MRSSDTTFETLFYENFDRTLTHTSCSPGMDPKTYPAYEEEYRVNTIERRFQQLLLNILMQQTHPPIGVCGAPAPRARRPRASAARAGAALRAWWRSRRH